MSGNPLSSYQTIAVLNEAHHVFLVQHQETGRIYVKKYLDVYNIHVYEYLYRHPVMGIPRIMEYCEESGRLIIIEEYIQGSPLRAKIEAKALTYAEIITYATALCDILAQLHALTPPIIHRDIKPSNIMITDHGQVVLLDFNAAKQFTNAGANDTVLLGTQGYAAPEQYGFGSSSPQTDIYAIGILLREMLISIGLNDTGLISIAGKCTQMDPNERYETVGALRDALLQTDSDAKRAQARRRLLPPGFRTGTLWKMVLSGITYILLFWMCLTLHITGSYGVMLWLERVVFLAMLLSVICCSCNYAGVQRILPICGHRNRIVRVFGVILLDASVSALWFMLLCIVVAICKSL